MIQVQNTVTVEQAQSLNKAIKEAGLEWPGIRWESGIFQSLISENKREVMQMNDPRALGASWDVICAAPNLAELAKMMPPEITGYRFKVVWWSGAFEAFYKESNSIPVIYGHAAKELAEVLFQVLHQLIKNEPFQVKAHWETL